MGLFGNKKETFLIVGLGNPEERYARTRHNCGFRAVDRLASELGVSFNKKKCNAEIGEAEYEGRKLLLVKPLTYMNASGTAVQGLSAFYKIPPERIVVMYDDIDIACCALRVRPSGSAGTHNGMRDIVLRLGTENFPRVRIGVGRPPANYDLADYVLGVEKTDMEPTFELAAKAALCIVKEGTQKAQQKFNTKG